MKKVFAYKSVFIMVTLIILFIIASDPVFAESKSSSYSWTNTAIEDEYNFEMENDNSLKDDPNSIRTSNTYYTKTSSLADEVRAGMVDRKQTIVVKYKASASELSKNNWFSSLCKKVINKAMEHTGVPEEGDSLKFCVKGYNAKASYFLTSSYSYITITFNFKYYTSSSQENKLDNKIKKLDLKGNSDYQTVKNIYNYICDNVKYSYKKGTLKYTAYNAAINKSAVCQGYSVLFYRLALEYDINARVIAGTGRKDPHVWNIVELNGKYYYLDATWDAGESKYDYFLKGYNSFDNHKRNSEYRTNSFKSKYPLSSTNYKSCSHKWNDFYTTDKKATYASEGSKSIHCSKCGCRKSSSSKSIPKRKCKLSGPENVKTCLSCYYGSTEGYDDIKIKWDKVSGASGYCIKYRKDSADKWKIKYTTNKYMYLKDLSDGISYEIRVYPYVSEKKVKYISSKYTEKVSVYTLKKTKITNIGELSGGYMELTWNGMSGETGYQIYKADNKDGKYSKVTTVKINDKKKTVATLKVKKGVTCWYKIRAYKSLGDDKCVYGPWSDKIKYAG